jgi:hypothetical protein
VLNQGLFYRNWLVNHKGDFALAAQKALGKDFEIDWNAPRLLLVAEAQRLAAGCCAFFIRFSSRQAIIFSFCNNHE